jgi:hypothetical protein
MTNSAITKRKFEPNDQNAAVLVREIVLTRLRNEPNFQAVNAFDAAWEQFYVAFSRVQDHEAFEMLVLDAFWKLIIQGVMMLGIAAERVFLVVCDSLLSSLSDTTEQLEFKKRVDKNPLKPKLDWLTDKFRRLQDPPRRLSGFPEDAEIQLAGIYNLIRCQRNDIGHPRSAPPVINRDEAYAYLRLFPSYYATAEAVRAFLAGNKI